MTTRKIRLDFRGTHSGKIEQLAMQRPSGSSLKRAHDRHCSGPEPQQPSLLHSLSHIKPNFLQVLGSLLLDNMSTLSRRKD
jgi:hypothetical protein